MYWNARRSGVVYGIDPDNIVQTGGDGSGGAVDDAFGGLIDHAEGAAHGAVDHAGDRFEQGLGRQVDRARAGVEGAAGDAVLTAAKWMAGGLVLAGLVALAASRVGARS